MELDQEQKNTLLEYEELKITIKRAEERIGEIKPILLEIIPEGSKVNAINGFFELKKRDNWKFLPEIENQEKELKETKASAIARGEAINTPTYYVEYRENKS